MSQDCGIHCGGRSKGWMCTSDNPSLVNFSVSHCAVSVSAEVPMILPQNCGWPLIAILAGDGGQVFDVGVDALAVDGRSRLPSCGGAAIQERVVELIQGGERGSAPRGARQAAQDSVHAGTQ